MHTYEINVAREGKHEGLYKLGRVSKAEAIATAVRMRTALEATGECSVTLYEVPVEMKTRIEF